MNMEEVTRVTTVRPEKISLVITVTLLKAVRTQDGTSLTSVINRKTTLKHLTSKCCRNSPYYYLPTLLPLVFSISGKE